jgi:hypothetical protein
VLGPKSASEQNQLPKRSCQALERQRKDSDKAPLFAFTALALSMGIAPVLATDTSTQPPTASTTSPEVSKSATMPPSGKADTSGGATEQSSSPPSAGSTMGKSAQPSGGVQPTPIGLLRIGRID